MQRRSFLKTSSIALVAAGGIQPVKPGSSESSDRSELKPAISLNAYSFNKPLLAGEMSLDELFHFTRKTGFTAVDLTAYYISGYPDVPEDKVLHEIKKKAFRMGLPISGTGVRNDFTFTDPEKLAADKTLVKNWIVAASKLGAPHVRVFVGKGQEVGADRKKVISKVIEAFRECADFAGNYGVMIAFQNHNDFIKSTEEVIGIMESVDSEWFGLMLDIGSINGSDPYEDIEKLIPYAISWQVKENVRMGNQTIPTDFEKLMGIVHKHPYHGFFPLETLGEGDPKKKVEAIYREVTRAMV
ncbi:MAG: sugar phosphate isomerase/epimerase [Bacteroidales bacterium]|nr:sugar phosphate isomerase/epimerase [Bacteroidales bacterium]